ncbi:hypothetical protein Q8A73_020903 [Channa argus]|nr:hypothetical protein Q8A73_020903 [Channa argus]
MNRFLGKLLYRIPSQGQSLDPCSYRVPDIAAGHPLRRCGGGGGGGGEDSSTELLLGFQEGGEREEMGYLCCCPEISDAEAEAWDAAITSALQTVAACAFGGSRILVAQMLVIKEEVHPGWTPSRRQDQDPEPLPIKEEQEELWTSQEGEQVDGLEEPDISSLPFTIVVKSEDDEEEPQSLQLHRGQKEDNREAEPSTSSSAKQMDVETGGEGCEGSELARYLVPMSPLKPKNGAKTSDCMTDISNDDNWQEPLSDSGAEPEERDSDCKETRAVGSLTEGKMEQICSIFWS